MKKIILPILLLLASNIIAQESTQTISKINQQIRARMLLLDMSAYELADCLSEDFESFERHKKAVFAILENRSTPIDEYLERICNCLDAQVIYLPNGAPLMVNGKMPEKTKDIDYKRI